MNLGISFSPPNHYSKNKHLKKGSQLVTFSYNYSRLKLATLHQVLCKSLSRGVRSQDRAWLILSLIYKALAWFASYFYSSSSARAQLVYKVHLAF